MSKSGNKLEALKGLFGTAEREREREFGSEHSLYGITYIFS